jgi:hypothetical protein
MRTLQAKLASDMRSLKRWPRGLFALQMPYITIHDLDV